MNSLEFIEFYIQDYKRSVEWYKKYQEKNPTSFLNTLKEEKLILHQLQQIKTKLEAWEETKKYIILKEGCVPLYDSIYEYIELENGCIDESNSEEEGKSIMVIKKALEVEENEEDVD